ncbi:LysR substrate-binding domain-containing protein [uncultured Azohydromonas sp.]|jgi:Transcriptional regulator|uniref:LysR substrate-binding domain-containing protein n=1 Tax=uncultured Azohydromonas sp. TaxID=487342 RepID=UPI00260FEDE9|nr:LysR substrate-binding domain-containing protein [uncultured Azohydromonas sp.]
MKLHSLRYFSVLAEELHFGRAADRLAITQPPLSSAIKALEEELGVRLFERDSKQVQLTPAGAAFLVDVQVILERVARAKETAKAVASGLRGRLDIGVTSSLFYRELPSILKAFGDLMPNIEVTLREIGSAQQVDALLHGELHAGFINAATVPPQLRSIALRTDKLVVCLPEGHALATRKSLRIVDLAQERFVMFDRDVAPANYDNVIASFSHAGVHPRTYHAARQWLTIIAMVANGIDIGLVPQSLARCGMSGVCFVPLRDEYAASPALMAWNPSYSSVALESFVHCAEEILQPETSP